MGEAKPSEFFVGVVEFFGVLLPGAILLAASLWAREALPARPVWLPAAGEWVAFAVAAYTLGTFVFLTGAPMDELIYDPWREARWPKAGDLAFRRATEIRNAALKITPDPKDVKAPPDKLPGLPGRVWIFVREIFKALLKLVPILPKKAPTELMNPLSWAKAVLILQAPAAHADVLRYEAESKFFRSMILVAPVAGWLIAPRLAEVVRGSDKWVSIVVAAVTALSFLRYAERRYKSTEWAYRYLIAIESGVKPAAEAAKSVAG